MWNKQGIILFDALLGLVLLASVTLFFLPVIETSYQQQKVALEKLHEINRTRQKIHQGQVGDCFEIHQKNICL
ncbi:MAG: hypothetical protein ACRCUP_01920 [Mycoplasmatales bacterium]